MATIKIEVSEYKKLLKKAERLNAIKGVLESEKYVPLTTLKTILGVNDRQIEIPNITPCRSFEELFADEFDQDFDEEGNEE